MNERAVLFAPLLGKIYICMHALQFSWLHSNMSYNILKGGAAYIPMDKDKGITPSLIKRVAYKKLEEKKMVSLKEGLKKYRSKKIDIGKVNITLNLTCVL